MCWVSQAGNDVGAEWSALVPKHLFLYTMLTKEIYQWFVGIMKPLEASHHPSFKLASVELASALYSLNRYVIANSKLL